MKIIKIIKINSKIKSKIVIIFNKINKTKIKLQKVIN